MLKRENKLKNPLARCGRSRERPGEEKGCAETQDFRLLKPSPTLQYELLRYMHFVKVTLENILEEESSCRRERGHWFHKILQKVCLPYV